MIRPTGCLILPSSVRSWSWVFSPSKWEEEIQATGRSPQAGWSPGLSSALKSWMFAFPQTHPIECVRLLLFSCHTFLKHSVSQYIIIHMNMYVYVYIYICIYIYRIHTLQTCVIQTYINETCPKPLGWTTFFVFLEAGSWWYSLPSSCSSWLSVAGFWIEPCVALGVGRTDWWENLVASGTLW